MRKGSGVPRPCVRCEGPVNRTTHRRFCSDACRQAAAAEHFRERFLAKVYKTTDCWLWMGHKISTNGYGGEFRMNGQRYTAHRASYVLFCGPIPDGMLVCHKCDIRPCVNPAHLFLGNYSDNMQDMYAKGRDNHPRGERAARAKLTRKDIVAIRELADNGEAYESLSLLYGVTPQHIGVIARRKTWTWLPDCRVPTA